MGKNEVLRIRGARVNNLKSVDVDLPLRKITCFAGPSGSGKTSLAFHTVYNESKRRFLNSFPTYLKFFSERPAPVDVDEIFPVLPVFGLPQINPVVGSRNIIADTMGVSQLFQDVYFHHAVEKCPDHGESLKLIPLSEAIEKRLAEYEDDARFYLAISRSDFLSWFSDAPFPSRSFNEEMRSFDESDPYWEVARFKKKSLATLDKKARLYLEKDLDLYLVDEENNIQKLGVTNQKVCPVCGREGLYPRLPAKFTAFNALGACSTCNGFGSTLEYDEKKLLDEELSVEEGGVKLLEYKRFAYEYDNLYWALKEAGIPTDLPIKKLPKKAWKIFYEGKGSYSGFNALFSYLESKRYKASVRIFIRGKQKEIICPNCHGSRIGPDTQHFYLDDSLSFQQLWSKSVAEAQEYFQDLEEKGRSTDFKVALKKTRLLLNTAVGVGLGHLNLSRKVKSVSPGEYQRLLLLKHLSYEGTGSLFIFDEPSLGLNEEEMSMLWQGFERLIKQGNTVFLIDHSEYFHERSDHFVYVGPEGGARGGQILYAGDYSKYKKEHPFKSSIKPQTPKKRMWLGVREPSVYGKTFGDFKLALNEVNWVTGPSGSGKSASLINVLGARLYYEKHGERLDLEMGTASNINGAEPIEEVLVVDANLNRYTSRSTVGSMTDMFSAARKHFLKLPIAKSMGLKEGHLSPNSALGQCPSCEGRGSQTVEMQFLEDIILECEDCKGLKLKPVFAQLSDGRMTVAEAYSMPIKELVERIDLTPKFRRVYEYLKLLRLDYLSLDRQVNSLSGGEIQRLYLLSKLQKEVYNSLLIFENLSFGLSRIELESLSSFLQRLTAQDNTIVLIDQNRFFENVASHRVDMG